MDHGTPASQHAPAVGGPRARRQCVRTIALGQARRLEATAFRQVRAGKRAEIWDVSKWNAYNKSKVEPAYRQISKSLEI